MEWNYKDKREEFGEGINKLVKMKSNKNNEKRMRK